MEIPMKQTCTFTHFLPIRISKKTENYCLNTRTKRALTSMHNVLFVRDSPNSIKLFKIDGLIVKQNFPSAFVSKRDDKIVRSV